MIWHSPTHLLCEAAQKTPTVLSPAGKPVEFPLYVPGDREGCCWLCAGLTDRGYPRDQVIRDTFNDRDFARAQWSDVVCEYCAWAFGGAIGGSNKPGGHLALRNYSFYARPQGLQLPARVEWRDLLVGPPDPPYLAILAVSGQKWLHFKGRIGWDAQAWKVLMEDRILEFAPDRLAALLAPMEALLAGDFSKSEVETGRYRQDRIKTFGLSEWDAAERRIAPHRGSRLFDLAVFVAKMPHKEGKQRVVRV